MSDRSDNITMNVSLPRSQKLYVEQRARQTGCLSVSEYVRRIIYDDQVREERASLESELLQSLNDLDAAEMTREDWDGIRSEIRSRLKKRTKRT